MVHVIFDTSMVGYDDYVQTGGGDRNEYNYFRGSSPYQRGYGIIQGGAGVGDVFRGIWRFVLPILRHAGTMLGSEALSTGQRILGKVNEGETLKSAAINESRRGLDNILERGGLPKQFGTGRKRKIKSLQPPLSYQTIIGRTITKPLAYSKKRLRSDVFGLY